MPPKRLASSPASLSPDEIHHDAVDKSVKLAQLIGGDGFDDVTHEELSEQ